MHTVEVPASMRCLRVSSEPTLPALRRVAPEARGPEGDEGGGVELELGAGPPEELVVLGVGARPPALDPVHAEPVELLGDAELVVDGEGDALELTPVAQRRVVD